MRARLMKNLICIVASCLFYQWCSGQRIVTSKDLLHSTIKIGCIESDGHTMGVGTGFFYNYGVSNQPSVAIPVIVTCKHVIEGSNVGILDFALAKTNSFDTLQPHFEVVIQNFESRWIKDPDPSIDVAVMPIADILTQLNNAGKIPEYFPFDDGAIITSNELINIGAFQSVKFIGYPIGISDEVNNLPVARQGITATDLSIDYEGKKEFLIDAAVFPGSSGSPVLIADEGGHASGANWNMGSFIRLIGIVDQYDTVDQSGHIVVRQVPTDLETNMVTAIPVNLGVIIKAEVINDFRQTLLDRVLKSEQLQAFHK